MLLPFFKQHISISNAHLDIGVGTGYYLANAIQALSKTKTVGLVDLNPTTLAKAGSRFLHAGYQGDLKSFEHDVFKPLKSTVKMSVDAISMFLFPPDDYSSDDGDVAKRKKEKLRETLLRYHPDKFEGRVMSRVRPEDQDTVKETVGIVARTLNALMVPYK